MKNITIFEPALFTNINVQKLGQSKIGTILPLITLLALQMRISFKDAEKHLIESIKYN